MLTNEGNELRVRDLRTGQQLSWFRAEYIRQPLWSRDGTRILVSARSRGAVHAGAAGAARRSNRGASGGVTGALDPT